MKLRRSLLLALLLLGAGLVALGSKTGLAETADASHGSSAAEAHGERSHGCLLLWSL